MRFTDYYFRVRDSGIAILREFREGKMLTWRLEIRYRMDKNVMTKDVISDVLTIVNKYSGLIAVDPSYWHGFNTNFYLYEITEGKYEINIDGVEKLCANSNGKCWPTLYCPYAYKVIEFTGDRITFARMQCNMFRTFKRAAEHFDISAEIINDSTEFLFKSAYNKHTKMRHNYTMDQTLYGDVQQTLFRNKFRVREEW